MNNKYLIAVGILAGVVIIGAAVTVLKGVGNDNNNFAGVEGLEIGTIENEVEIPELHNGESFEKVQDYNETQESEEMTEVLEIIENEEETTEIITSNTKVENTVQDNDIDNDIEYEKDIELQKLKEEFEKNKEGEVLVEGENVNQENMINVNAPVSEKNSITDDTKTDEQRTFGENNIPIFKNNGYVQNEVLCDAQTREEAEQIATQISGTVVSYEHGVATIQISGSVDDLLNQLEQQGSNLELYRNYCYTRN